MEKETLKENLNEVIWYGNHFNLHKGYIRYRESPNSEYRRYSYSDLSAKVLDAPQYEICEWLFTFKGMAYAAVGFFVISAFSGFASFLYLLVIALTIYGGYKYRRLQFSLYFNSGKYVCELLFSGDKEQFKNKLNVIEHALSRKKNILDKINWNLNELLGTPEADKYIEREDGNIKFIDYFYDLDDKVAGLFDKVCIRIFGTSQHFYEDVTTHLIFSMSKTTYRTDEEKAGMVLAVEPLMRFLGKPNLAEAKLSDTEEQQLFRGWIWPGRQWFFNRQHKEFDKTEQSVEEIAYIVTLNAEEKGIHLNILDYHNLVQYFG